MIFCKFRAFGEILRLSSTSGDLHIQYTHAHARAINPRELSNPIAASLDIRGENYSGFYHPAAISRELPAQRQLTFFKLEQTSNHKSSPTLQRIRPRCKANAVCIPLQSKPAIVDQSRLQPASSSSCKAMATHPHLPSLQPQPRFDHVHVHNNPTRSTG
ncbi:hypothetical protein U1Q18_022206 [Sarracenia purpurea var. burkii]